MGAEIGVQAVDTDKKMGSSVETWLEGSMMNLKSQPLAVLSEAHRALRCLLHRSPGGGRSVSVLPPQGISRSSLVLGSR